MPISCNFFMHCLRIFCSVSCDSRAIYVVGTQNKTHSDVIKWDCIMFIHSYFAVEAHFVIYIYFIVRRIYREVSVNMCIFSNDVNSPGNVFAYRKSEYVVNGSNKYLMSVVRLEPTFLNTALLVLINFVILIL